MQIKKYVDILNQENLITKINIPQEMESTEIKKVSYNSKDVVPNTLFVCKGLKYKEEYLLEAIQNGAIVYVAEEQKNVGENFPCIIVSDIRKALSLISILYYDYPATKINMIGLTGTKGKSTTSYYIKSILDHYMESIGHKDTAIISSIDTYDGVITKESVITSPESLELQGHIHNAVNSGLENLVMEVSSQALKLNRVYGITYKVGAFLNISEDHISTIEHPNFEDYFTSKLLIFHQVENAVINLDSDMIEDILKAAQECKTITTFSTRNETADIYAYDIQKEGHETIKFKVKSTNATINEKEFALTMPGLFNVENALCAIATSTILNVPYESIYEGLKNAKASGRMELHTSKNGKIVVIVDYAHNKLSFERLYESTKAEYPDKYIVTVFGCPGGKAQLRRMHLGELAGKYSKMNYLTAEDPGPEKVVDICNEIASYIEKENGAYQIIEDRGEAIKTAILENENVVVLITGKGNETRQKIGTTYVPCLTDTEYAINALKEYDNK